MRIAIDATPLTVPVGGIRRYVVELTRALAVHFPGDRLYLLSDQRDWTPPAELSGLPNLTVPAPPRGLLQRRWWSLGLPWDLHRHQIDIFHGPDFAVPYLPMRPTVLVVHDLSPWKSGPARAVGAGRIRARTPYLLRLATMIVTPSESIRHELADAFGLPLSKIVAVPLAASDIFQPLSESTVAARLQRIGLRRPYLLFWGAPSARKNLPSLLAAWRQAKTILPELDLVLVGPPGGDTIKEGTEKGLHVLGPLPDSELRTVLSGAIAFVYPSFYEGFGLPILESMRTGTPVITSRDPAISEVAGGAALQVEAGNTTALRRAILEVVAEAPLRARLQAQGMVRASQFSWRSTAVLTRAVYEEAIRRY